MRPCLSPGIAHRSTSRLRWPNTKTLSHWFTSAVKSDHSLQGDKELWERRAAILDPLAAPPSEAEVEGLFQLCREIVERRSASHEQRSDVDRKEGKGTPASALLGLNGAAGVRPPTATQARRPLDTPPVVQLIDDVSDLAHQVIVHPHVFISPALLRSYVDLQAVLQRPRSFPEVFHLYACKPIPKPHTKPVRFKQPRSSRAQFAIPEAVASKALRSAIHIRDLELALAIIERSYALPAFRRAKLIRRALIPGMAVTLTPLAVWAVAAKVSAQQLAGDGYLTTEVAFAGILAYLGFTGTLGFVALTTANDHMDRVTWLPGTPLRERWIREDERAAIDQVAVAWGFRNPQRHGEEEGQDWEAFRLWVARKGMILDQESLLPGTE